MRDRFEESLGNARPPGRRGYSTVVRYLGTLNTARSPGIQSTGSTVCIRLHRIVYAR